MGTENEQRTVLRVYDPDFIAGRAVHRRPLVFGVVNVMTNYRRHDESPAEYRERTERAEAEASSWFNDLTKPQSARFNERMSAAAAYKGAPRWDREKAFAEREFHETTPEARRVCELVFQDMMTLGEISEATSYAFDEVAVAQMMQQAAE